MIERSWSRIFPAAELPEGHMRAVSIAGRNVVICHSVAGFHALDNLCTHAYAYLHEGRLRGTRLICPLHGASFDCRTGNVLGPPAILPLKRHELRIVDDHIEVALAP